MKTKEVCGGYESALKEYAGDVWAVYGTGVVHYSAAAVLLTEGSVLGQTGTCRVPNAYFQGPSIPGTALRVSQIRTHQSVCRLSARSYSITWLWPGKTDTFC